MPLCTCAIDTGGGDQGPYEAMTRSKLSRAATVLPEIARKAFGFQQRPCPDKRLCVKTCSVGLRAPEQTSQSGRGSASAPLRRDYGIATKELLLLR